MSRILFTLMVAAVSVAGIGGQMTNAADAKADSCCIQCKDCERTCLACVDACLDELAGKADRKNCIKLCLDCADICGVCSKIAARGGPLEATIAVACADACEKCAAECEKHKDDKACQACAEQCKKCAKECKEQGKKK